MTFCYTSGILLIVTNVRYSDRRYHILEKHIRQAAGLSRLAQIYIFSVTTSADAERSFSKYKQLLTPQQHTRLAAESKNLCMLEFLYWNLNT